MSDIVCIFGATSTGKSELAVYLAGIFSGEVIGADSMQVYSGFDIGTGKLKPAERKGIRHHLLDCCDPCDQFSAGSFQKLAGSLIEEIRSRQKLPIIAGGTGLYFRALLFGLAPLGPPDRELRARLRSRAERKGIASLYRLLYRLDEVTAGRLPPNDSQRILRALEYRIATGEKLSDAVAREPFGREQIPAIKIGLYLDRSELRKRIDRRVDRMFDDGWVEEVKQILDSGVSPDCHALRAIGYREIVRYLKKEVTLDETKLMIKTATRQYAKRQETWFRKEQNVFWLEAESLDVIKQKSKKILLGKLND